MRYRRPRRSVHVVVRQPAPSGDGMQRHHERRRVGRPGPAAVRRAGSVRRRRPCRRPPTASISGGSPSGRRASRQTWSTGSSNASTNRSASSPKAAAMPCATRRASSIVDVPGAAGSASRSARFHSGSPSLRHTMPSCQRGSGSPGYHLPWPCCSRPPGAKRSRSRLASTAASARFVLAVGGGVPLGALHVVDRHERRLTTHRQPDVAGVEAGVDLLAEFVDPTPLFGRVGQGDPRVLADPVHDVGELELDLGEVGATRRSVRRSTGAACRPAGCGLHRRTDPTSDRGRSSRRRERRPRPRRAGR